MVEAQIRMEAADNVKLRGAFANTLFRALVNLFKRKRVRAGRVGIAAKGAKFAMRYAHIGRIDVPVDVVIRNVAMAVLANVIRKPADRKKIGRTIQRDAVLHAQALASEYFLRDGFQPLVRDCQFAHFESAENFKRAKPLLQRPRTTGTIN